MDSGRACFWAAGTVFALFVIDICAAKIQILSGAAIPIHLGDTMQFLVLLVSVTFFVAGTIVRERDEREGQHPAGVAHGKDT